MGKNHEGSFGGNGFPSSMSKEDILDLLSSNKKSTTNEGSQEFSSKEVKDSGIFVSNPWPDNDGVRF